MWNIEEYKEFIQKKHGNQKRKQGTPYYLHPIAVANKLKEKGFNENYQIVGLFHDLLEDTDTTYDELVEISNNQIADAVVLLTKEKGYIMEEYINNINNNQVAKMVKLADRIHNLEEVESTNINFKRRYLKETNEYYIKLAENTVFEEEMNELRDKLENSIKNIDF